mmetsp:Transcript_4928/g.17617  ORF Transcript_4928/g.17617 Transcript_4928/m.17617 type:complete len:209 (+) Transcript_4928:318-944(+)
MRCESGSVPSRCHRLLPALVRVEFPPQALLPRLPRARQPLRLLRARGLPHLPRAPQLPRLPRAPRHLRSELEIQAGLAGVARRLPRILQADSAGAQERLRLLQPPFLPHPRPLPPQSPVPAPAPVPALLRPRSGRRAAGAGRNWAFPRAPSTFRRRTCTNRSTRYRSPKVRHRRQPPCRSTRSDRDPYAASADHPSTRCPTTRFVLSW